MATKPSNSKAAKRRGNMVPGYKARVTFGKHILPPVAGLVTVAAVLLLLNYPNLVSNLSISISRRLSAPALHIAPADLTTTGQENQLLIEKLNLKAPVLYSVESTEEYKVQLGLREGIVHYGQTAVPGDKTGNVVLLGHSTGAAWAPGSFKFVFADLKKLEADDRIIVDYNGTRYIYQVYEKTVVQPTDMDSIKDTGQPTLTLITCTPAGAKDYDRLLVRARQISPRL